MPNGSSAFEALYQRGPILGRGASGVAFVVRPNRQPHLQYVAKELCVVRTDEKRRREAHQECQMLRDLDHLNIVKCIDVFQDDELMYIIMEYADGGDLSHRIQARKAENRRFNEQTIMSVFVQICAALHYIHARKILHRDIKPPNVFVVGEQELQTCTIKLGDFGIAKMIDCTMGQAYSTVGTPSYLSPEICKNTPYAAKSDIWSLGVVLYELACLKVPFHASNLPAMALMICTSDQKPLPEEFGAALGKLVKDLLQKDPGKRPTVKELLQTPYVHRMLPEYILASLDDLTGAASAVAAPDGAAKTASEGRGRTSAAGASGDGLTLERRSSASQAAAARLSRQTTPIEDSEQAGKAKGKGKGMPNGSGLGSSASSALIGSGGVGGTASSYAVSGSASASALGGAGGSGGSSSSSAAAPGELRRVASQPHVRSGRLAGDSGGRLPSCGPSMRVRGHEIEDSASSKQGASATWCWRRPSDSEREHRAHMLASERGKSRSTALIGMEGHGLRQRNERGALRSERGERPDRGDRGGADRSGDVRSDMSRGGVGTERPERLAAPDYGCQSSASSIGEGRPERGEQRGDQRGERVERLTERDGHAAERGERVKRAIAAPVGELRGSCGSLEPLEQRGAAAAASARHEGASRRDLGASADVRDGDGASGRATERVASREGAPSVGEYATAETTGVSEQSGLVDTDEDLGNTATAQWYQVPSLPLASLGVAAGGACGSTSGAYDALPCSAAPPMATPTAAQPPGGHGYNGANPPSIGNGAFSTAGHYLLAVHQVPPVPLPAEMLEPAPPFAGPHSSSLNALYAGAADPLPRMRTRIRRRGRPPLIAGQEALEGEVRSPMRPMPWASSMEASSGNSPGVDQAIAQSGAGAPPTLALPSAASARARSVSPALKVSGLRASEGTDLPEPVPLLRSSGSAPALPPLPPLMAQARVGAVRSRSVAALHDHSGGTRTDPVQRGAPHMFRTAPLPISCGDRRDAQGDSGTAAYGSQGPPPPPSLAPPSQQPPPPPPQRHISERQSRDVQSVV